MTSPITSFMADCTTVWEALTPPTRTTLTYSETDGKSQLTGTAGHRKYIWLPPLRQQSTLETTSSSLIEWMAMMEIRFSIGGASRVDFADLIANETNLLVRAIEKKASWSAGIAEVVGEPSEVEWDPDLEDALVRLTWRVTVYETD